MSSAKQYLCPKCGKEIMSSSGLIRHFNTCTKEITQIAHLQIHHKLHNDKVETSDGELEDRSQLLDETNYTIKNATNLPTKSILWNGLLASESLLLLREEWFTRNEFPACIPISNIKYNHLGIEH